MPRRYAVLDVFTDRPLAGNPLAVVLDGDGLEPARMQAIAAEFNLSETVFVLPPSRPGVSAKVRIFTPAKELPFAGHPTVGTAVLLATDRLDGVTRETDAMVVLEEEIGIVRCGAVIAPGRAGRAVFDLPKLPEEKPFHGDVGLAASALGLDRGDIGFENHVPSVFGVGHPFVFVPIRDRAAMARIRRDMTVWAGAFGAPGINIFVYTRDCAHQDGDFHARMFAPELGIGEDPATGSAAASFAGVVMRFDGSPEGERRLILEQGYEMGRPSRIELEITVEKGRLAGARIGGAAVIVARGELAL
ncbi:PhzF family phenazine biosynthesis protein [Oharaeibacter diazotrophicus]|uniref:Trans-2,3-dihydro-3-hydroxyanthranilate isomerase n=1 Tax=Oharaeibacter diazotrophicus TaxID=1920512 RepID=A0A4R6RGX3_9HYPH|nr:PhzF family phenazine biosynthesis protein [Oharaeibacter diazotrophicus]TDP85623.1 trans-2,3-dihydro-3-hydroxyanthranilate isomerase [Oharaeibacter diazotrophicus]BBE74589.1 trans-2,3-dihydro-3-hydroxyanthranilate isomerase [Pleomorphomonas sp. SM30]GLS75706.1 isomerase [Oharaeibacter diazotrophicus]